MKNMIITVGAVILIITISSYQLKCNKLLHDKRELKFTADEAAATAALYLDWKEYGEGHFVFNKEAAEKAGKEIIAFNLKGKEVSSIFEFVENDDNPRVRVLLQTENIHTYSEYEYLP